MLYQELGGSSNLRNYSKRARKKKSPRKYFFRRSPSAGKNFLKK
jgi:hypothetical protein